MNVTALRGRLEQDRGETERIPDERLEALPDTAYCVRDAKHEERK